jgi:hypothetical protein
MAQIYYRFAEASKIFRAYRVFSEQIEITNYRFFRNSLAWGYSKAAQLFLKLL